jgi:perosamine synthetase
MELKVNFSGRAQNYKDDEIQYIVQAIKDADPLTQGKYRDEFEQKFSNFHNIEHSFSLCNATAGLELAAQMCLFNKGDEVIIPGHTFTPSAYPFLKNGAKIVWADIDLKTRVVNAESISRLITKNTKAIVVVHLYGYIADMPEIANLAKMHNLILIEDAAQAIGTEIDDLKAGTFSDFGIYSFHSHKNITTLGEGGMITVKDKKYADIIPMLRHNGHCAFNYERDEYWNPAMGNVDLPILDGRILHPNNYCLGEIECALGSRLIERVGEINQFKQKRALHFIDALSGYDELEFHRVDSKRHNYHLLVGRMKNGKRDKFIDKMFTEKRIKCVTQYYPLYRYDYYKKSGLGNADCPNTDLFFDNMVSFPFQEWMSDEDFDYVLEAAIDVLGSLR